jgi:hypothetical protein
MACDYSGLPLFDFSWSRQVAEGNNNNNNIRKQLLFHISSTLERQFELNLDGKFKVKLAIKYFPVRINAWIDGCEMSSVMK